MIVFDGVSIDTVAPVMIEDIKVSPISYNPVVRPRAIRFGSEFVRMGGGERKIVVTFAVLEKNPVLRHEALMNISQWAKTDAEHKLELPDDLTRYLQCVCTGKPEPSTRAWWENKLRLTFTCYENPYWTSKAEKSVGFYTSFFTMGDAPPLMRIEADLTNEDYGRSYTDTITNDVISLFFNNTASGRLVIDLNKQTITVADVAAMHYYQPSSTFFVPHVGSQRFQGTGTIYYRERWE